jgi:SPP1 gp7 family putative phage head morphogenesis protein
MTRRPLTAPGGQTVIDPVHANVGIGADYKRRLLAELKAMHDSLIYWISAAYRANPPVLAQDAATPASAIVRDMRKLGDRWLDRFDKLAPKLATHFGKAVADRSDKALADALRRGGMSVRFTTTPAVRDVLAGHIAENVSLIKTIAAQHFGQIEQQVMRSVQRGGDLQSLVKNLQQTYGVTRRRATLIATDQNRKATANIQRARQIELGINRAIWLHSGGGNEPRPSHVAKSGKTYNIDTGWFDRAEGKNGEWLWPGTAINCRCVSKAIIPGA